jgi:hypothetical protein
MKFEGGQQEHFLFSGMTWNGNFERNKKSQAYEVFKALRALATQGPLLHIPERLCKASESLLLHPPEKSICQQIYLILLSAFIGSNLTVDLAEESDEQEISFREYAAVLKGVTSDSEHIKIFCDVVGRGLRHWQIDWNNLLDLDDCGIHLNSKLNPSIANILGVRIARSPLDAFVLEMADLDTSSSPEVRVAATHRP